MRSFRPLLRVLVLITVTIPLNLAAAEPSTPYLEQCVERFQAEGTLDLGDARLAAARLIPLVCGKRILENSAGKASLSMALSKLSFKPGNAAKPGRWPILCISTT